MNGAENVFLDTNVPVYPHDVNELVMGPMARALLAQVVSAGRPLLSTQVLSEFYWTVTRRIRVPLDHDDAAAEVKRLEAMTSVVPVTWDIVAKALDAAGTYGMPLWDGQIFAAALLNGATVVLSEDFQHRRTIEGVTFLNPFAPDFQISDVLAP